RAVGPRRTTVARCSGSEGDHRDATRPGSSSGLWLEVRRDCKLFRSVRGCRSRRRLFRGYLFPPLPCVGGPREDNSFLTNSLLVEAPVPSHSDHDVDRREPSPDTLSVAPRSRGLPEPGDLWTEPATERPAESGRLAIPGYEVIRTLGRGGTGVVYLARQAGF